MRIYIIACTKQIADAKKVYMTEEDWKINSGNVGNKRFYKAYYNFYNNQMLLIHCFCRN
jgi:hypothetical protein